jgi:hypothetical protein
MALFDLLKKLHKPVWLLLLLITAQQGAVVHELSHLGHVHAAELRTDLGGVEDAACALCPAYAQVVTPAFSHTFHIPRLIRTSSEVSVEPRHVAIDAAVPTPRSRGPPASS